MSEIMERMAYEAPVLPTGTSAFRAAGREKKGGSMKEECAYGAVASREELVASWICFFHTSAFILLTFSVWRWVVFQRVSCADGWMKCYFGRGVNLGFAASWEGLVQACARGFVGIFFVAGS